MKISLIAKQGNGWHQNELKKAAEKFGVDFEITDIKNLNNIRKDAERLGEVVIWRAGSIDLSVGRTTFLASLKDRHVINRALFKHPFIAHKLFQQKTVEKNTTLNFIPTFTFKTKEELVEAINTGTIKFPFIQKPNLGSKGNGVSLIKSMEEVEKLDIKFKDFIYQNFIKNSGDYRVFVLGGRALGAIKRIAAEGNFLNNVSKGGSAQKVENTKLLSEITEIACTISSLFDLTMCGVDIIFNEDTQQFHFLEVNTAPQWSGFQAATGIIVGEEIVKLAKALSERTEKPTLDSVLNFYNESYDYLYDKKVHFDSRMYLWTREEVYKKRLEELKEEYIGLNEEQTRKIIGRRFNKDRVTEPKTIAKKLRKEHFDNHPNLKTYNAILFLNLFARTLYNEDITKVISEFVADEEFLKTKDELINDKKAISVLSTHAVNYFYLLDNYLQQKNSNYESFIDANYFLELTKSIETNEESLKFKIYLLTHCIIGASRFYSQKIVEQKEVYVEMMKYLEKLIFENYFAISIDNKFEFLVCAKLCDYKSNLESLIMQEADRSFADFGNFLVDKLNDRVRRIDNKLTIAEHRNVLFIMASLDKVN